MIKWEGRPAMEETKMAILVAEGTTAVQVLGFDQTGSYYTKAEPNMRQLCYDLQTSNLHNSEVVVRLNLY